MFDDFPFELILFLIAALIGVIKRVVDVGKKLREKSKELESRRQQETHVRFDDLETRQHRDEQRAPQPQPQPATPDPLLPPYGDPVETALGREPTPPDVPAPVRTPVVPPRRRRRSRAAAPVAARLPNVPDAARRDFERQQQTANRRRVETRERRNRLVRLLRESSATLRDAVLLREILGPPVALRGRATGYPRR